MWARGKSLYEVRSFLGRSGEKKFDEIKEERKNSLLDEKIDIFTKERLNRKYFNYLFSYFPLLTGKEKIKRKN